MFLSSLSADAKKIFWGLANSIVLADGSFTADEGKMLDQYKWELQMDDQDLAIGRRGIAEMVSALVGESKRVQKIIYFELLALAYADADYSKCEREEMAMIQAGIGLSDEEAHRLKDFIIEIIDSYSKIDAELN